MRNGRGFRAVIVSSETQPPAIFRRPRRIAVTEHVAAAIDARALAVPDADDTVVPGAFGEIELLRTPDRSGGEVFVHAGLEFDVVLVEVFAGGEKLLVVAAERRATVAADETGGVQSIGPVAADLRHWKPDQGLRPGQKDMAGPLGVFLVETDRTLVYSHSTLLESFALFS